MTDRITRSRPRRGPLLATGAIALALATGVPLACGSDNAPSTPRPTGPGSTNVSVSGTGPEDSTAGDVTGATTGNGVGGKPPDTFAPTTTVAPP